MRRQLGLLGNQGGIDIHHLPACAGHEGDSGTQQHTAVGALVARVGIGKMPADVAQRDGLWQAQTPQMFRYGLLGDALQKCRDVTDEAGAVEALGLKPKLVRGDATNLKVTYPADLALAAMILRARK